ncbi:MAG: hypothetical protein HY676_04875 [Chloroflexi bacterium]|nr:hypothetical protein [Chloroflexota bacterium]
MRHLLRPYQVEIGRAVMESVLNRRGLTFTVEIARQGGKNELSAQLELLLLTLYAGIGGNLVKAAPTYLPQVNISLARLKERLADAGLAPFYSPEAGHVLRLGKARQIFLSADASSHVVGTTAHILLEIDEAQDVNTEKYHKEFRPMGASTNVTTVLYGTPWDQHSLLEEVKQRNLELERVDGIKRHFRFDWCQVANHNPSYRSYVEAERQRLGESHPIFRTQYLLDPLHGETGLLSPLQRAQLQGDHQRQRTPQPGRIYVASLDLAGQASVTAGDASLPTIKPYQDSTILTIGELDFSICDDVVLEPRVNLVQHYWWTGTPHSALYPQLLDLLKNVWHCRRIVVDATGLGQGMASFLQKALGSLVEPFIFTSQSKSRLGFQLLAAVNAGRVKMYAPDGSPEFAEFWHQIDLAQSCFKPNQTMNFFVDASKGHDDFLSSLALLAHASQYLPRIAHGRIRELV